MSSIYETVKWLPDRENELRCNLDMQRLSQAMLGISGGFEKMIYEMNEFPIRDPWSQALAEAIQKIGKNGRLNNNRVIEFGTGVGPQLIQAAYSGKDMNKIIGVDIDPWKLAGAQLNFERDELMRRYLSENKVDLYQAHAIKFLDEWDIQDYDGYGIICLPQADPGDSNNATSSDVIGNDEYVMPYVDRWGPTALQLNAGTLNTLAWRSDPSARSLLVLSGRVSPQVREELIAENGWEIEGVAAKAEKVKQDPDTPLSWMMRLNKHEKGDFYDENGDDLQFNDAIALHAAGKPIRHDVFVYDIKRK